MKLAFWGLLLFGSYSLAADLPTKETRSKIFEAMVSKMKQLDGEALYVRNNRSKSWDVVTDNLKKEAEDSSNWFDFMRAFIRLDQTYPNLHSSVKPGQEYLSFIPKRKTPKVGFVAEWLAPHKVRYVVSKVASDVKYSSDVAPKAGDEIIAINGRKIDSWKEENFESCKFPLKAQCDSILPMNFQKELLTWTRNNPLSFTIKRGEKSWTIPVEIKESETHTNTPSNSYCKNEKNRYQQGFHLVYTGNRACIYESQSHPDVAVLRITSFQYSKDSLDENETITSVGKEIDSLYSWWSNRAIWKHLVVDVIDNYGGQAPIEYYQILFQHEFQEQYVTFRRTPEMEDSALRASIFWGDSSHEIWFQNLIKNGIWDKLSYGDYTPPTPMFCVDEAKDCSQGLFPIKKHPFRGRVSVLLNEWCISSCDGFAYNLKDKFGSHATYFGHPQAADTAYSRLTINVILDSNLPNGFKLDVVPLGDPSSSKAFMSQTVVVSRSTWEDGTVVSGKPVKIDKFVPITYQSMDSWPNEVLKQALK